MTTDELYGTDVWLRPEGAAGPRLRRSATGDFLKVSGREAYEQSILRRWLTPRGEWKTKPDYGGGLRHAIKAKATSGVLLRLGSTLRSEALKDARTKEVLSLKVTKIPNGVRVEAALKTVFDTTVSISKDFTQ